jgi:histidinol phosphatase-like enzyme
LIIFTNQPGVKKGVFDADQSRAVGHPRVSKVQRRHSSQ